MSKESIEKMIAERRNINIEEMRRYIEKQEYVYAEMNSQSIRGVRAKLIVKGGNVFIVEVWLNGSNNYSSRIARTDLAEAIAIYYEELGH